MAASRVICFNALNAANIYCTLIVIKSLSEIRLACGRVNGEMGASEKFLSKASRLFFAYYCND